MKGGCSEVEVVAASVSRHTESVSREEGASPPRLVGAGRAGKKPRRKATGSGFCRGGDLGPAEDHTGDPATGRCLAEEKACRPGQQPGQRPAGGKGSFPRPPRCSRRGPSVPAPGLGPRSLSPSRACARDPGGQGTRTTRCSALGRHSRPAGPAQRPEGAGAARASRVCRPGLRGRRGSTCVCQCTGAPGKSLTLGGTV